ncbi:hypothetical protein V6Z11_D12G104200 [Gossypium hirsutum]
MVAGVKTEASAGDGHGSVTRIWGFDEGEGRSEAAREEKGEREDKGNKGEERRTNGGEEMSRRERQGGKEKVERKKGEEGRGCEGAMKGKGKGEKQWRRNGELGLLAREGGEGASAWWRLG